MDLSTLSPQQAKPLEIMHETRWMDALRAKKPAPQAAVPPIFTCAGWRTSIAVRTEQFEAAEELVARRYAWRGYTVKSDGSSLDDSPKVILLAEKAGQLMGTLTVRPDALQGLYAEITYGDEIQRLRRDGHRLGEAVKLAVEEGGDWKNALDSLVQATYLITRVIHGLTDVVIEVNPRHVGFYRRVLGFVSVAAERICERVGAPSVLMRLDLEAFGRRLQFAA